MEYHAEVQDCQFQFENNMNSALDNAPIISSVNQHDSSCIMVREGHWVLMLCK